MKMSQSNCSPDVRLVVVRLVAADLRRQVLRRPDARGCVVVLVAECEEEFESAGFTLNCYF